MSEDVLSIFRAYFDALSRQLDGMVQAQRETNERLQNLEHAVSGLKQTDTTAARQYEAAQHRIDASNERLRQLGQRLDEEIIRRVDPGRSAPP